MLADKTPKSLLAKRWMLLVRSPVLLVGISLLVDDIPMVLAVVKLSVPPLEKSVPIFMFVDWPSVLLANSIPLMLEVGFKNALSRLSGSAVDF